MNQIEISFTFNGINTNIQCTKDIKFKDILKKFRYKIKGEEKSLFFMYNGTYIKNEELTFNEIANSEDKKRNKMNILVNEIEEDEQNHKKEFIIKSKNIICPKCKEDIKFKIEEYNILLYGCKNNHEKDNIFFGEFDSTQNLDISKIICNACKIYNKSSIHNNIFYRCNTCKKDLCPICFNNHEKNHNIINYDDKNYICEEHNKIFMAYCKDCRGNICMYCEKNHINHCIV